MRDYEIGLMIDLENKRQEEEVCLIASENYTYKDVMEAQGSCLTNKYAEGYPGKRYYAGCEFVDKVETLAIERCKELFNCKYANVQPHSGSQANQAVYAALLKPHDTVLAMDLNAGAHITHISKASYTSKLYNAQYYGLNENGEINLEELKEKLYSCNPTLLIVGGSSYTREIDYKSIREILDEYNKNKPEVRTGEEVDIEDRTVYTYTETIPKCLMMVDMAHIAGLVATGFHQSPVPYADVVTSTTHKTLRGPRGGFIITNDESLAKKIDTAVFPRTQGGPLEHVIAGKAVCFSKAKSDEFKQYMSEVVGNIKVMEKVLSEEGIDLVSGGSDNHMLLLDLKKYNISGKDVEERLNSIGIVTNKNTVPNDTKPKMETSGLRIGTPAITTRCFTSDDCKKLAKIIARAVKENDWSVSKEEVLEVRNMCLNHPIKYSKYLM